MSRIDRTMELWNGGRSCAQAVAEAFAPSLGLAPDQARAIARGFGSGMGMGATCGAVTGAAIVLGLGEAPGGDEGEARQRVYVKLRAFTEAFEARHGSSSCRTLLGGLDLGTPGGYDLGHEQGLFDTVCPACVRTAAELLEAELG